MWLPLKIQNKFFKSDFGWNVFTLFTGTSIAQIIPFIISPILTRLYAPEDFGLLALFTSVFSFISIIVTLQYESAIILPKKEIDAVNLVGLCLFLTLCITIISLILVIVFNGFISKMIGNNNISYWLYYIPIPVFLTGLFNTLNFWATRKKQYERLAYRTVTQSTTTAFLKMIFGFSGMLKSGLIYSTIIGQAASTSVLTWLTWKDDQTTIRKVTIKGALENAKKYKNFPKYVAWQGFFDMFNSSGTTLIISTFMGTEILGLYSFTLGLLQKPLQLIGNSIAQVYYQKISDVYNAGGDIWLVTKKIIIRLTIIALIIFTPLALAGPKLFSLFFGTEWTASGVYARILLPWLIVRFIGSPITSSVNIVGKQRTFFYLTLVINILFPTSLFIALKFHLPFHFSLLAASILICIYLIFIIIWIKRILENGRNKII